MLTAEEDVEITSLRKRGWSISAIARHVGRDRKTVRAYLSDEREPGVRERAEPDVFDRFEPYVRQRLGDDQHVWATTLFDELVALGFDRSYQTFTRKLRERALRPHCERCSASNGRAHVDIDHPAGEEIQWDWLELDDTPWGEKAYVLVGALAHSSRFRAWFSDRDDQAHLVVGIDEILRRLGGTTRRWRVDRMATVINPNTGRIQRSFAPVAKHYGVGVDPCPPRHGNRKGVVEKNIDFLTRRWWRTARVGSPAEAQASIDRFCATIADGRPRGESTVGALADAEPLLALPERPYPAEVLEVRTVAANALVSLWGNRYSVRPASSAATSRSAGGSAPSRSPSTPAAPSSPHTSSRRGARSARSGSPSTPPHWRTLCSTRSPPASPASQGEPATEQRRARARGRAARRPRRRPGHRSRRLPARHRR